MRGGALPPALLAAALGFALAFAARRAVTPALVLFAAMALVGSFLRAPDSWTSVVFAACWISVVICALCVHLRGSLNIPLSAALALNAGLWTGAVIGQAGTPVDLLKAAPWVLLCLPARWVAASRMKVAVKVVASWLVAVAVLAAMLPATTKTPGYVADHME